jgi:hypothetical protein
MKHYNIAEAARAASAVLGFAAVIGLATGAWAQTAPKVISSSETDSGSTPAPTLTMQLPAGVEAGQLLLATIAIQGSNPLWDPWAQVLLPSGGWTELVPFSASTCGGDLAMAVAWRIAQSTDTPKSQFTWGFLSGEYLTPEVVAGGIVNISNVNNSSPIEAITSECTTDSTSAVAQPFETANNNDLDVLVFGITGANDLSKPVGYSGVYQEVVSSIGPDISNAVKVIPQAFTTVTYQTANAAEAGDSLGFQVIVEGAPVTEQSKAVRDVVEER